jgi:hypothetical protein
VLWSLFVGLDADLTDEVCFKEMEGTMDDGRDVGSEGSSSLSERKTPESRSRGLTSCFGSPRVTSWSTGLDVISFA